VPLDLITGKPRTDLLFPEIAFNHLAIIPGTIFLLGLTAATFATTDSALAALTTSFCVDFLGMEKDKLSKKNLVKQRYLVHFGFSMLMFVVIIIFNLINDASVVSMIFKVASYTYGPLIGLYFFGLVMKKRTVIDNLVPVICILSPAICFFLNANSSLLLGGYVFDNELILVNATITFIGLLTISKKI
jgi:Na+/pantothenate symporter